MSYEANDIETLGAGKAFREKLGMYLTGEKQEAINLGLRELIVNVQDEYEVYPLPDSYCKITLNSKNRTICCEDNARGIPVGQRDDGINSLTAAFLIPHSGGKHRGHSYSSAIGCNGEGNKIVCHTAEWLKVEVKRDNNIYYQSFHSNDDGATADEDVKVIGRTTETGTKITYVPDKKVYGDIFIDIKPLKELLRNICLFSKGLRFILDNDGEVEEFYSKNGLIDGISNSNAISKPFSFHYETEDCKVELALQWVKKKGEIKGYANSLYVKDGGRFISAFKSSLTRTFNSLAKAKFEGERIRNVLSGFVSVKVKVGQWANQQKTSLANPEAGTATSAAITECLKEYSLKNPKEFNQIVALLIQDQKAEKAADRAREAVLNQNKSVEKESKKKTVMGSKLKDCRIHDEKSILYIAEGDSALGAFTASRDSTYVAAMPIRGKIINALKNPLEKVLENEEVQDVAKACGCGILDKVKVNNLRYGKIAFAADADPDGFAIVCLLLVLFYVLMPELIKEGKIYWAQFPSYEITINNKLMLAYNDEELANILAKYPNAKYDKNKGLGEMDAQAFAEAAYGENARLIQFTMNDVENATHTLELLLGKRNEERSDYIFSNVDFKAVEGE